MLILPAVPLAAQQSAADLGLFVYPAKEQTKEQLYRKATRLEIEGRSKMTKQQLERAVARASS